jgi:heme-degrading monooxygenase HmoA
MSTTPLKPDTDASEALRFPLGSEEVFLWVEPEPARRLRASATDRMEARIRDGVRRRDLTAGTVFTGSRAASVAGVAAIDRTAAARIEPRRRFTLQVVDTADGGDSMVIDPRQGLFHFINVFTIAPDRQDQIVDYFRHTIPAVRKQPGYVATNLLVNAAGTHAVNLGQYERREDFVAIFRQSEVIRAFSQANSFRVLPRIAHLLPVLPRLRLYGVPSPIIGPSVA